MITTTGFWKGRDATYKADLTPEILANAKVTIERANRLLAMFYAAVPSAHRRDSNSGWRPPAVNAATAKAAKKSNHMLGLAVDVSDDDEALDTWLMTPAGQQALVMCELWMEHPSATPRWAHLQTVPPRSGRRVFYP